MKNFLKNQKSIAGFSLLEVLVAVMGIGTLASVAVSMIQASYDGLKRSKLQSDVNTVNRAVSSYTGFAGSLDGVTECEDVLVKLKTRSNTARQSPGLSGSFIDPRIKAVYQTSAEAADGNVRACWDAATRRFVMVDSGPPGIKEFILDEQTGATDAGEETRSYAFKYNSGDGWIWNHQNDALAVALAGPTEVAETAVDPPAICAVLLNSGPMVSAAVTPPTINLAAPQVSVPGGTYPITDFDLPVSLINPNPGGVAQVVYSVNYGSWENYNCTPIEVGPNGVLEFQAISLEPNVYASSSVAMAAYQADPVELQLPVIIPSAGQFTATNPTVDVSITNPNDPSFSQVNYRINGGGWTEYAGAFTLESSVYPTGATVEGVAVSTAPFYLDSSVANAPVGAAPPVPPNQLVVPQISLSKNKFDSTTTIITVTLTDPNPAPRSTLRYAVKLPAAAYPPLSSFLPYSGPFQVSVSNYPEGFHVQAYAKALDPANFLDSNPAEAITTADFFGVPLTGDVLIVLDASGSMNARFRNSTRFAKVVEEAIKAVGSLGSTQKFSVIAFSSGLVWSDGSNDLKLATAANKQSAIQGINSLVSQGGTNYEVGLSYALNLTTKPTQIIFLSDGLPNQQNYLDDLNNVILQGIKVNTIGVGNDSSFAPLVQMANLSGGTYTSITDTVFMGSLSAPKFSKDGNAYDYDDFPIPLTLTNPNAVAGTRILYSINDGPFAVYSAPLSVDYNTQVDAYVDSTNPSWASSVEVSESYTAKTFDPDKPEIILSADTFTDAVPTITVTLNDKNQAGLTTLVWWFSTEPESAAVPYNGPFTLPVADWNSFAGDSLKEVLIYARAVPAKSFVIPSDTRNKKIENKTTVFLANLNKPALKIPVFSPDGNSFDYTAFPISVTLVNPNGGVGQLYIAVNGAPLASYSGAVTVGYGDVVSAYVKAAGPGSGSYKSSPVTSETYSAKAISLAKPTISLSAPGFTSTVTTITVTMNNPNPAGISGLVYWFAAGGEASAVPYTGPFTLSADNWESIVTPKKSDAKIYVKAVSSYSFVKASASVNLAITNSN